MSAERADPGVRLSGHYQDVGRYLGFAEERELREFLERPRRKRPTGERVLINGGEDRQYDSSRIFPAPVKNRTIEFFDTLFQRQVTAAEYALNPFEKAVLPFIVGDVVDMGCGLGNLSIAAAAKGCRVTALDGSPAAIADLTRRAAERKLAIIARRADLRDFAVEGKFDSVVAIGLLMFFPKGIARKLLTCAKELTKPGGIAAVNVLIEGTTYLDMFEPNEYHLFSENELPESFAGWALDYLNFESFPAPNETVKRFCTLVARRPTD